MRYETFDDIYSEELAAGAILNERHPGFREDYLVLHCLLRKHKIKSCFEIGTHVGWGTAVIKNAMGEDSEMYSLDLPNDEGWKSQQHPTVNQNGETGSGCSLPYTQLLGDSRYFDYSKYRVDAFYCDGEHSYMNVYIESCLMIENRPRLIMWHDADCENVYDAVMDAFRDNEEYELIMVTGTRILYALKK